MAIFVWLLVLVEIAMQQPFLKHMKTPLVAFVSLWNDSVDIHQGNEYHWRMGIFEYYTWRSVR